MMSRALLAVPLLLGLSAGARADAVGHYKLEGHNPDGTSEYSGTVDVQKTGDTYKITWKVEGGDTSVGTGIGDDSFLSSAYKSGSDIGIALFVKKGDNWEGVWTYAGGRKIGSEKWTPQ